MDKITGNFLTQANKDFPLDCETLDYLQTLSALACICANVAGDRIVLFGCETDGDGTRREPGYVFLRTQDCPTGEVLRWAGGPTTDGMYVCQEDIAVNANNISYPKAYTRRYLAPGIGDEHYSWDDFTDIMTIKNLMAENRLLNEKIKNLNQAPLGIVQMWAGAMTPDGYLLCTGQELAKADYPELYAAIGDTFNKAMSSSGSAYTTSPGHFRLPDLRGRFIVGYHDSDDDYKTYGSAGGDKMVGLVPDQLPAHNHAVKDYMMIPDKSTNDCDTGEWTVDGKKLKVGGATVSGNTYRAQTNYNYKDLMQWVEHDTENAGKSETHENRPPYYVLAYIMRVR